MVAVPLCKPTPSIAVTVETLALKVSFVQKAVVPQTALQAHLPFVRVLASIPRSMTVTVENVTANAHFMNNASKEAVAALSGCSLVVVAVSIHARISSIAALVERRVPMVNAVLTVNAFSLAPKEHPKPALADASIPKKIPNTAELAVCAVSEESSAKADNAFVQRIKAIVEVYAVPSKTRVRIAALATTVVQADVSVATEDAKKPAPPPPPPSVLVVVSIYKAITAIVALVERLV
jgi:hypothetical protein